MALLSDISGLVTIRERRCRSEQPSRPLRGIGLPFFPTQRTFPLRLIIREQSVEPYTSQRDTKHRPQACGFAAPDRRIREYVAEVSPHPEVPQAAVSRTMSCIAWRRMPRKLANLA